MHEDLKSEWVKKEHVEKKFKIKIKIVMSEITTIRSNTLTQGSLKVHQLPYHLTLLLPYRRHSIKSIKYHAGAEKPTEQHPLSLITLILEDFCHRAYKLHSRFENVRVQHVFSVSRIPWVRVPDLPAIHCIYRSVITW